jgi:hypothetical protein
MLQPEENLGAEDTRYESFQPGQLGMALDTATHGQPDGLSSDEQMASVESVPGIFQSPSAQDVTVTSR